MIIKPFEFKLKDGRTATLLSPRDEDINGVIESCDKKKKSFYTNILRCCNKFGFERLYNLALEKRNRIIKR